MIKLVLVRHGESEWNKKDLFTGWVDVDLTKKGIEQAHDAGKILRQKGFTFDVAYTSVLKRAIRTLWIVLDELDRMWIPINNSWRLNERDYGALQGKNKIETAKKFGEEQVKIWRRSYDIRPPPYSMEVKRKIHNDPKYRFLDLKQIPSCESLKDTEHRVMPYWHDTIVPKIKDGKKVIIVASHNSLRALVKHLDDIPPEKIMELNIPTGVPLIYELDKNLKPTKHYYLGDQKKIQAGIAAVINQGKVKK